MRLLDLTPQIVLAVYAHPDDADVAAGGILALWASRGAKVHLITVCDGDKGSSDAQENPESLRRRRQEEFEVAAKHLGSVEASCLGYHDGEVTNDVEFREKLVSLIRKIRPDVVVGPDPTATFFGGVYVNHRDHRETGWALLDAIAPAAAMPLYCPETGVEYQVPRVLLSGTHEPDVTFNIASVIETKILAVLAHASQVGGQPDLVRQVVTTRAQQSGRDVGVSHGESFRYLEFAH
jgi:LmbE family N-acetylglucosaminyl deacetylase